MRRVLLVSACVHIAAFALMARTRAPAPTVAPPAPVLEELVVEVDAPPVPESAPAPAAESRGAAIAIAAARRVAAPSVAAPAAPLSSAGVEPVAGANTDWVVNLGAAAHGSALAGRGANPFLVRPPVGSAQGPVPEGPPKKEDALANGLKSAFLAPDQVNGIVAPVAHALESETRTSLAPVRGNAVFRAIVDATGAVTSLQMLETTGDRAGWDDARAKALAALQQKKLNLRGANGAMIDIRVESELRYPSGATNRVDVTGPLSLSGDVSDFGVKPTRSVRARVQSYTPL